ncbi:MAG: SDR family oxidoreductase [Alphaproteobacteria bacterium]|nr:SDR family oxidoreductase [Alphaproteobacteria bacterium]
MTGRLEGKAAIITGGTNGIGVAIVEVFAREGARVLFTGRNVERGKAVERAVKAKGGIWPRHMLADMTERDWDHVLDNNLKSTFLVVKACMPAMTKQHYGRIVLTTSITGNRVGIPGLVHYSASKGGQNGFLYSAAIELAPHGIAVNGVEPGNILVRDPKSADGKAHIARYKGSIPLKRLGRPEEIANTVLFLASDEASYITGQTIIVDGGQIRPEGDRVIL